MLFRFPTLIRSQFVQRVEGEHASQSRAPEGIEGVEELFGWVLFRRRLASVGALFAGASPVVDGVDRAGDGPRSVGGWRLDSSGEEEDELPDLAESAEFWTDAAWRVGVGRPFGDDGDKVGSGHAIGVCWSARLFAQW